jgi:hypothetical protein
VTPRRGRLTLSQRQREMVLDAADRLSPPSAYGFTLRCETKPAMRGDGNISDALLFDIIARVLAEYEDAP